MTSLQINWKNKKLVNKQKGTELNKIFKIV